MGTPRFTPEFKEEAVRQVTERGYSVADVSERLGVSADAPRDKCTLSCAINGIHAAFHYLKKNYISGCVMTVPTGW